MGALHELELYTGASCNGWGGHVDTLCVSRRWRWHSNRLKLEVMALSVRAFLPTCAASLTSTHIQHRSRILREQAGAGRRCALQTTIRQDGGVTVVTSGA